MAYCVRGASNPNLTFTHPVAPSVALGRIVAYRNVNTSSPKDTQTSFTTATGTTAVSGTGLTTTQIEDLIVAMAAGGQEAAWSAFNATDPAGATGATSTAAPTTTWLERADSLTTTGADTSLAIFDAVKTDGRRDRQPHRHRFGCCRACRHRGCVQDRPRDCRCVERRRQVGSRYAFQQRQDRNAAARICCPVNQQRHASRQPQANIMPELGLIPLLVPIRKLVLIG